MTITPIEVRIRDICDGYEDNDEEGVTGYDGKLNIRPAYQREYVYDRQHRDEVIRTIQKGFPLNVMYWGRNADGTYELMDGQQRTISFCKYVDGEFSIDNRTFYNLTPDMRKKILDYKVQIYVCDGAESEKLDWFRVINIAGMELSPQELRNAVYTGDWLTDAKRRFSKPGCVAGKVADKYLAGNALRQDYLQEALSWISDREGCVIEDYMSRHQHFRNCNELWQYFMAVMDWVKKTFTVYRPAMKGIHWGILYNKYSGNSYDPAELEKRVKALMSDEDITSQKGIYEYLLSGNEKYLSIRVFSDRMKAIAYERQGGICPYCAAEGRTVHYTMSEMEADHITPWVEGGRTDSSNCQLLCREHNRRKGAR
ncbi:MAG: DUF262 domain-containing protein [Clostridia bacterium]|nr:DUF262 domain-containing protein [Clostridia bacterium]